MISLTLEELKIEHQKHQLKKEEFVEYAKFLELFKFYEMDDVLFSTNLMADFEEENITSMQMLNRINTGQERRVFISKDDPEDNDKIYFTFDEFTRGDYSHYITENTPEALKAVIIFIKRYIFVNRKELVKLVFNNKSNSI
jgi:hypothetical protein